MDNTTNTIREEENFEAPAKVKTATPNHNKKGKPLDRTQLIVDAYMKELSHFTLR